MVQGPVSRRLVHRTACIRLRVTKGQAERCYKQLRSAGDLWAWLLDTNRQRFRRGDPLIVGYQALCHELAHQGIFGELSVVGARSVLRRYSGAWFQAAKRRRNGQPAGFPRRKRSLVPVRFHGGTFLIEGRSVRLPVAKGHPELWIRLARPIPYPIAQVRAVSLLHDAGHLWLAVTAAVPVQQHAIDPARIGGVDLGIVHPYVVVVDSVGLLVSGRAIRAESYLHLRDQQARRANAARRAPTPGQRGSRRWRRHRARLRTAESRHRRRVHKAQNEAARHVIAFAVEQQVGMLVVGDLTGITNQDAGRVQNLRLRQWRRTHLVEALRDKAEQAGIQIRLVDERGSSSTCPSCGRRGAKPKGRRFRCRGCDFYGHRDLVGAHNIAAKAGGGDTSGGRSLLVEHRRAGTVSARRDRRRHLYDQRRRSCLASGLPDVRGRSSGCRSPGAGLYPAPDEDQALSSTGANDA
jgi:IS605 OrfB family transposase